jgi:aspartate/methionine/tyrosine aminotransferase
MIHFNTSEINFDILRKRAYNGRWATLPQDVIPLTAADPDFPIATEIKQGICDYVNDGYLSYGPFSGLDTFKQSVANHYNLRKGADFAPDDILAVNSAAQGMFLVAKYLLQPNDEAIILDPVDFLFKKTIEVIGGKVKLCRLEECTGVIDLEHLESLITPKTKLISICNPHNPLGVLYSKEILTQISEIALKHDVWVMSDEIWSDIIYEDKRFYTYSSVSEAAAQKSFTVYGFSKTFGLAGLRIGAVLCKNEKIMLDFIEKSNFNSTIEGVSTLSQVAASVALDKAWYWATDFVNHLQKNRDLAVHMINSSGIMQVTKPEATFVIFPKITNGWDSDLFVKQALEKGRVAIVPGSDRWFGPGANGHVRICFSTSAELLQEGIHRIIKSF